MTGEELVAFVEVQEWHRSGAETYLAAASAQVRLPHGPVTSREFVAKAIVSWTPDLARRAEEMTRRYRVLADCGVRVPRLFAVRDAVIYQEFIPHHVTCEAVAGSEPLLREVCMIAAALDALGAQPTDFLRDLMCTSTEVYYVDVGEDLGGLFGAATQRARQQLLDFLPETLRPRGEQLYDDAKRGLGLKGEQNA